MSESGPRFNRSVWFGNAQVCSPLLDINVLPVVLRVNSINNKLFTKLIKLFIYELCCLVNTSSKNYLDTKATVNVKVRETKYQLVKYPIM